MPIDYSGFAIPKPEPRKRIKAREKRAKVKTDAEVREYVFMRERNICRVCRKRQAESRHELQFRSQRGKVSKTNCVAVCGDGVRGCHGFLQRHEIQWFGGPRRAEETLTFWPNKSQQACDWLAIKMDESIESAPMREMEMAE